MTGFNHFGVDWRNTLRQKQNQSNPRNHLSNPTTLTRKWYWNQRREWHATKKILNEFNYCIMWNVAVFTFFPGEAPQRNWKQFELMQLLKIDVLLVLVRSGWSEGFWRCLGPRRPYCNPLPYVAWFYSPSFRIKTGIFRCSYTVSSVTGACATRLNENDIPLEPNLSISS